MGQKTPKKYNQTRVSFILFSGIPGPIVVQGILKHSSRHQMQRQLQEKSSTSGSSRGMSIPKVQKVLENSRLLFVFIFVF